ncbi:MAG TPA: CDP-diacylglycerol--glycerol-3-phosphate 3-phosphatidyltransferase [Nitrospirae bacterium]|nr:CDP-diacylglycerol--glycerol-3-phosphate 3-phosphatidyltransferase [Nitrospirota bacterium]
MVGNLPNFLTLARILLLPFFAATLIYEKYQYALLIFIAASITDLLDGFIARRKKQITYFGTILDPVADKFFLITSFIIMSSIGLLPKWLTIIVISKDLIVVTGCIILYIATHSLKVEPSFLGKAASMFQFILIGLVLLSLNVKGDVPLHASLYAIVAVLTALSGIHYVYKGLKIANAGNNR